MADETNGTQALTTAEQRTTALLNPNRDPYRPSTFAEAVKLAQTIVVSGLAPKGMEKPEAVFVAMMMGAEVGLSPMQAVQNIAVINGRPSLWGDAALAVVQAHPAYEWHDERSEGEGQGRVAIFRIKRKGSEVHEVRFSMAEAKTAGLAGKQGPWTQYQNRMLQMRARGFGLRDKFADALRGLNLVEEAMDAPIISQAAPAALPEGDDDPMGDLRARADLVLIANEPQYNRAQRIAVLGKLDQNGLQNLIAKYTTPQEGSREAAAEVPANAQPEVSPEAAQARPAQAAAVEHQAEAERVQQGATQTRVAGELFDEPQPKPAPAPAKKGGRNAFTF